MVGSGVELCGESFYRDQALDVPVLVAMSNDHVPNVLSGGNHSEHVELELAALPHAIASLSSALQQSNHNLEICHSTLLQSLNNESKLKIENQVIKKMRKKDNSYWRSRYVVLKEEKKEKEDDYEMRITSLQRTVDSLSSLVSSREKTLREEFERDREDLEKRRDHAENRGYTLERRNEELERQSEELEKQNEELERRSEELKKRSEGIEKQLLEVQETRAHDLDLLSTLQDQKATLERKLAKYKDLFSKTKEWHDNEVNHKKTVQDLAYHADSNAKAIHAMQANIRSRVVEMQMEFAREIERIVMKVRLQDSQHSTQEEVLRKLVTDTETKFLQEQHTRKALHNALIELRGNIRVFCRIRPYLDQQDSSWACTTDSPLLPLTVSDSERVSVNLADKCRTFDFDKVFDADADQEYVFSQASPLVTSLLDGFNVAIMAYGQTGSGKTYTMQGTPQEPGIIPKALELLFNTMRDNVNRILYKTEFSMVEIYNEAIYDLLDENDLDKDNKHELHQTASGTEVSGLSTVPVQSLDEVNVLIAKGHRLRAVAETRLNSTSSRSHCVVVLTVEVHHLIHTAKTPAPTRSKLYLVDLAGSENVGLSGATGDNLREASYINRSLSSLGDVLGALAEGRGHIPYRNSRLTHMLQDALGGEAKMLLLVTVSPGVYCQRETMHALAFGVRARQVARGPAKKRSLAPTSNGLVSSASTPNLSQTIKNHDSRPTSPLNPPVSGKNSDKRKQGAPQSTLLPAKPKARTSSGHSPKFGTVPKFRS